MLETKTWPALRGILCVLLFLAAAAGLAANGTPQAGAQAQAAAVPEYWDDVVASVERLRGLRFKTPVTPRQMTKAELVTYLRRRLEEELPGGPKQYFEAIEALGLVAPGEGKLETLLDLYAGQVGGFYDPAEKRFYIVPENLGAYADVAPGIDLDRAVFAHELVHALQDQHFAIGAAVEERSSSADRSLALHALLEGEAMDVMVQALMAPMLGELAGEEEELDGMDLSSLVPKELWKSLAASLANPALDPKLANAPRYFVEQMVFPYAAGSVFVTELREKGGWDAIDRAHRTPPESTEEVMHPELYTRRPLAPLRLAGIPRAPWRSIYDDTFGEWGLGFFAGRALDDPEAGKQAARGWDGDHVSVYRGAAGAHAVVWVTRWDDESEAREFAAIAARAAQRRAGGKSRAVDIEGGTAIDGPGGRRASVRRRGLHVLYLEGLSAAEEGRLAATWDGAAAPATQPKRKRK